MGLTPVVTLLEPAMLREGNTQLLLVCSMYQSNSALIHIHVHVLVHLTACNILLCCVVYTHHTYMYIYMYMYNGFTILWYFLHYMYFPLYDLISHTSSSINLARSLIWDGPVPTTLPLCLQVEMQYL